jgi:2-hydroxy-3-keto-5-methylthiopentenyl-1-phosphate phosphatase
MNDRILVTDFDGTITSEDFYQLTIDHLLPRGVPNHWLDYRSGAITHFEALRRYFAEIRKTEREVLAQVAHMNPEPMLPRLLDELADAGWRVVVVSAGCDWYIRKLLAPVIDRLEIHANTGEFVPGRGLLMRRPDATPFPSENLGVDKAAVVRHHLQRGAVVAFAGDGYPDADAARLVPANLRFAKDDLAEVMREERLEYRRFDRWREVAEGVLNAGL